VPDFAYQFSDIRFSPPRCLDDDARERLLEALHERFGPTADIRTQCLAGSDHIGIWLRQPSSDLDAQARDRGVERLDLLGDQEAFGLFISSSIIRASAREAFDRLPKRYDLDDDLIESSDGPIHLTNLFVTLESPNRVVTHIDGFDEDSDPDLTFHATIADSLSAGGGVVNCATEPNLEIDADPFGTFLAALLSALTIGVPFLPGLFLRGQLGRLIGGIVQPSGPDFGGVGCAIANNLPREVMISGGQKVVFFYTRVAVNELGIFSAGIVFVVPRTPAIVVRGDSDLLALQGEVVATGNYRVGLQDVLKPRISWTAENGIVSTALAGDFAQVEFMLQGLPVATAVRSTIVRRTVTASVVDLDNSAVLSGEISVRITVRSANEPPLGRDGG
jgi:hypothetical protein